MQITDFQKVRTDGRILPHPLDVAGVAKLGWKPAMIIELRWRLGERTISHHFENGVIAKSVPGDRYVAALIQKTLDPNSGYEALLVYNGDGSVRFTLPTLLQTTHGVRETSWEGFETMATEVEDHFGAIAGVRSGNFGYVVNASTGAITLRGESR